MLKEFKEQRGESAGACMSQRSSPLQEMPTLRIEDVKSLKEPGLEQNQNSQIKLKCSDVDLSVENKELSDGNMTRAKPNNKRTNQATELKDERMTTTTYIEGSQQAHLNGG